MPPYPQGRLLPLLSGVGFSFSDGLAHGALFWLLLAVPFSFSHAFALGFQGGLRSRRYVSLHPI
jgi:hypothetical protein